MSTTVAVQLPDGSMTQGTVGSDGRTRLPDGSRPPAGSTVYFNDGKTYSVVDKGNGEVGGVRIDPGTSSSSGSSSSSSSSSYSSSTSSSNIPTNLPPAQQYVYIDKYGFPHVTSDLAIALQYSSDGNIYIYDELYGGVYALEGNMTTFYPTQPFIPQQAQPADFNYTLEQMRRDNERMLKEFQQQQQQVIQAHTNQDKYQQAIMNKLQGGLGYDSWSGGEQQNQQKQNQQKSTPRINTDSNTSQAISRYLAKDMWADK